MVSDQDRMEEKIMDGIGKRNWLKMEKEKAEIFAGFTGAFLALVLFFVNVVVLEKVLGVDIESHALATWLYAVTISIVCMLLWMKCIVNWWLEDARGRVS